MGDPRWREGARITWNHYRYRLGAPTEERGEVSERGPAVPGARVTVWVKPDDPDLPAYVLVGKADHRTVNVHGDYNPALGLQRVRKGEAYSSDHPASPLGAYTLSAAGVSP